MSITSVSVTARRSPLRHAPLFAAALAAISVLLLGFAPLGWRLGWWHYRFALLNLLPWAAYFGVAALIVSVLTLCLGRSRIEWRGVAIAVAAFVLGGLVAYVPWHYDAMRRTLPPINDITTDTADPPAFAAVISARKAEEGNLVAYPGAKFAEQQQRAYADIVPVVLALPPKAAFERALAAAEQTGWTIAAADAATGRIEATDRSRWFGFTDDIVVRVTPQGTESRVDVRSSARHGRSDFGVNAARVRAYLAKLREASGG